MQEHSTLELNCLGPSVGDLSTGPNSVDPCPILMDKGKGPTSKDSSPSTEDLGTAKGPGPGLSGPKPDTKDLGMALMDLGSQAKKLDTSTGVPSLASTDPHSSIKEPNPRAGD